MFCLRRRSSCCHRGTRATAAADSWRPRRLRSLCTRRDTRSTTDAAHRPARNTPQSRQHSTHQSHHCQQSQQSHQSQTSDICEGGPEPVPNREKRCRNGRVLEKEQLLFERKISYGQYEYSGILLRMTIESLFYNKTKFRNFSIRGANLFPKRILFSNSI